jgi:hypothetical protein
MKMTPGGAMAFKKLLVASLCGLFCLTPVLSSGPSTVIATSEAGAQDGSSSTTGYTYCELTYPFNTPNTDYISKVFKMSVPWPDNADRWKRKTAYQEWMLEYLKANLKFDRNTRLKDSTRARDLPEPLCIDTNSEKDTNDFRKRSVARAKEEHGSAVEDVPWEGQQW